MPPSPPNAYMYLGAYLASAIHPARYRPTAGCHLSPSRRLVDQTWRRMGRFTRISLCGQLLDRRCLSGALPAPRRRGHQGRALSGATLPLCWSKAYALRDEHHGDARAWEVGGVAPSSVCEPRPNHSPSLSPDGSLDNNRMSALTRSSRPSSLTRSGLPPVS